MSHYRTHQLSKTYFTSTIHAQNNRHWIVSFLAFLTCFECFVTYFKLNVNRDRIQQIKQLPKKTKAFEFIFVWEIVSVCMTRADRKFEGYFCWMFLWFAFNWFTLAALNEAGTDFEYLFALAGKRPPINLNSMNPQDPWKSCPKNNPFMFSKHWFKCIDLELCLQIIIQLRLSINLTCKTMAYH